MNSETEKNKEINVIMIQCDNCVHCIDLESSQRDDPKELKEARDKIRDIFKIWLMEKYI